MKMGIAVDGGQRELHCLAHAHLVDVAHVEHLQPHLVDQLFLTSIDRPDANLAQPFRLDRRHLTADLDQGLRPQPAQAGHRHAVEVATGGQLTGVEVGMSVQPQHAQFLARFAAVPRHRADRSQSQAMVATQQDRQFGLAQHGQHGIVHHLVPGQHLWQVAVAVHRRQPWVGRADQVAPVCHLQAQAFEHGLQPSHPQRFRAHAGAAAAGADVGGRADQADAGLHGRIRPLWPRRRRSRSAQPACPRPARRSRRSGTNPGRWR